MEVAMNFLENNLALYVKALSRVCPLTNNYTLFCFILGTWRYKDLYVRIVHCIIIHNDKNGNNIDV